MSSVTSSEARPGGAYARDVDNLRRNAEGKLVGLTVIVQPLRGCKKAGRADRRKQVLGGLTHEYQIAA